MARVFISYRREDSSWAAARLRDAIEKDFGSGSVFMDTADIIAGQDFRNAISGELTKAKVVLAVIGAKWMGPVKRKRDPHSLEFDTFLPPGISHAWYAYKDSTDPIYKYRINERDDMVRFELTQALTGRKTVLPILIDGAAISPSLLPAPLDQLARFHQLKIAHATFEETIPTLIKALGAHTK